MSEYHEDAVEKEHKHPNYFAVFLVLAAITALITAIEMMSQSGIINLPRASLVTIFLLFSITKALLVAMFYMHLKYDSFLYTVLFGLPVLFAVVFFTLLLI